jgi:hypothetical protein
MIYLILKSPIVMDTLSCDTSLVKSNSLPILNPTLTHSLIVSQKDSTYCHRNIYLQGQLVTHYTHHMLTHKMYVKAHFNLVI